MNDTGIRDIFERKHPRTGMSVAALVSVFHQLDVLTGRAEYYEPGEIVSPNAWDNRSTMSAREPTVAELMAYPLAPGDYAKCKTLRCAQETMARARSQFKKGWLTKNEFAAIEDKCLRVIANQADKG